MASDTHRQADHGPHKRGFPGISHMAFFGAVHPRPCIRSASSLSDFAGRAGLEAGRAGLEAGRADLEAGRAGLEGSNG